MKGAEMENENLVKMTGTCRFCGQSRIIDCVGEIPVSEADEIATGQCDCNDAKVYQNRQRKINKANEWAKNRFEKTPNVISLFEKSFEQITNHDVTKVSITEGDWTHNISLDSDGFLSVKSGKKVTEEVEFS